MSDEIIVARPPVDPGAFDEFGCRVYEASPSTPDRLTPTVRFHRQVADFSVTMADGKVLPFWGFKDPNESGGDRIWPSKIIRVNQGSVVHCELKPAKNTHTIHWHGIEPTPMNDGVGHTSFEVKSDYTYQWYASQAGTYFYHCHKNTVLHFEMGMYGMLIVDPPNGPGRLYAHRGADNLFPLEPRDLAYAAEAIWVYDDVDPRWHTLDHSAGICGEDVGLDRFEPKYFLCSGVPHNQTMTNAVTSIHVARNKNVLLRVLNASYSTLKVTFPFRCYIAEADGRPLRWNPAQGDYSQPKVIEAGESIILTTAQRRGIIVRGADLTPSTSYTVRADFLHWVTNQPHSGGQVLTKVNVAR
ncbi:multicopper oxidase domain-containing protein [Indioceanicola profundi]|uniref:multicopper oxidase domain-containing protein n=1 Tax=Indioceanicola profundi TaxID=2220096 RepID=UPI000E6AA47F|nr:multicopper oxidase domain-containing protein [Indioceanicola profundi]